MTFSEYLFKELEAKDQLIHELQQELQTMLKTDDQLLIDASQQIELLKQQCTQLAIVLRATLIHLQQIYEGEEVDKLTKELCTKPFEETLLG